MSRPVEREVALLVVGVRPAATLRRIMALRTLDGFELRRRGKQRLEDTYLDTPDGRLAANGSAFRIRRVSGRDGTTVLTLKGPGSRGSNRVVSRGEIEVPLSLRSVQRIVAELRRMNVPWKARMAMHRFRRADLPKALGLVPVQHRSTERDILDVYVATLPNEDAVAEIAVDRVAYRFSHAASSLFEIEIEAKGRGTSRTVSTIATALLQRFPNGLQRWAYSKLATGKALEAAARSGRLGEWTTATGRLRDTAIPVLSRRLQRR